jgi:mannose-6-phosphate isomerase
MSLPPPFLPPVVGHVDRPWGSFRQYVHNGASTVSLMTVQPGQRLSLQSHARRAELWIVLDPGAIVQVGEAELRPQAGDEIWIPATTKHRLSSAGPAVRVLEVAFGDWQQDDITRHADDYQRGGEPDQAS